MRNIFRTVVIEAERRPTPWTPSLIKIVKHDDTVVLAIYSENLPDDVLHNLCSIHEDNVAKAIKYLVNNLNSIEL